MAVLKSLGIFLLAGLFEISGGYRFGYGSVKANPPDMAF